MPGESSLLEGSRARAMVVEMAPSQMVACMTTARLKMRMVMWEPRRISRLQRCLQLSRWRPLVLTRQGVEPLAPTLQGDLLLLRGATTWQGQQMSRWTRGACARESRR